MMNSLSPRILSLYGLTIVIVGISALEIAPLYIIRMVVHHIEDDTDACLVESLHHLFELTDATCGVVGISAVTPLWYIVVDRVIAPVILRLVKFRLVHGTEIIGRQDVDGVHTEFLQVFDGAWFGECEEFAAMFRCYARRWVDGEIAMVHLVDDEVGRGLCFRPAVVLPPYWIGFREVDNTSPFSVNVHSLGKHSRCFPIKCLKCGRYANT